MDSTIENVDSFIHHSQAGRDQGVETSYFKRESHKQKHIPGMKKKVMPRLEQSLATLFLFFTSDLIVLFTKIAGHRA
jgi:hypothetical protein